MFFCFSLQLSIQLRLSVVIGMPWYNGEPNLFHFNHFEDVMPKSGNLQSQVPCTLPLWNYRHPNTPSFDSGFATAP